MAFVAANSSSKRPAWNVPSNGAPIEVSPVMGADSWPALAEAAKASSKSVSSDSLKSLSDSSGPLVPSSLSPKPANIAQNPNLVHNPMRPAHQKSMKRGGGNNVPPNSGVSPESSPKGSKSGGPHGGGDQHRGYNGNNRRGNYGSGSHHQDHEWNNHHRNAHMQHQQHRGGFLSYMRPPPLASPSHFVAHTSHVRPFVGNAMGFHDFPSPLYFVHPQPCIPHPVPHAMFLPAMDPQRAQLLKQIDYYFSTENLCRDLYLRHKMDDQGWVPISLIAGFKKVKELTNNIQYILDTMQFSTLVEVQGDKIRRQNDWMNWLLHPSNHSGSTSSPQSLTTLDYDALVTHLQNVGLEGVTTTNHNSMRGPIRADVVLTRSASGNLHNQFEVVGNPSSEGSRQFSGYTDSDRSWSSRNLSWSDTL